MRRFVMVCAVVAGFFLVSTPSSVSGATTTTSSTTTTSVPLIPCSATTTVPVVPGATTVPFLTCALVETTTTTTTTTTTLPSAVTTVPEGCALPPIAQAVFIGTLKSKDLASATFQVSQVRAGSLEGYLTTENTVVVRYGNDVKYLDINSTYIVGVEQDSVTSKLASTVRDAAELFGGAEVAGSNTQCPEFEEAARTIHADGSAIDAGLFVKFFDQPLRLVLVLVLPTLLVISGLIGLVWFKRGTKRS